MPKKDPDPDDMRCGCEDGLVSLSDSSVVGKEVTVARIAEVMQSDVDSLANLRELGLVPGAHLLVLNERGVVVQLGEARISVPEEQAQHVYVSVK